MTDPDERSYHGTEMRNMTDGQVKKKGCCTRHPGICCCVLLFMLVLAVITGALLGAFVAVIESKVDDAIGQHVKLQNGSTATNQFLVSSAPLYVKYYFFNITNPEEVLNGAVPHVEEYGPCVYRKNRTGFDPHWEDNDTVLSYKLAIDYTYENELSLCDPTHVKLTVINVPLVVVALKVEEVEQDPDTSKMERLILEGVIDVLDDLKKHLTSWEKVFTHRTVDELLFGYEDSILRMIHRLDSSLVPNPIFALSNRSTVEQPNRVFTGVNDTKLVGQYLEWNNHTEMKGWGTPTARMINGTGGFLFHPGVTREENLIVFVDELYRSGYFAYTRDVIIDGIQLYQFELPGAELLNATQDPGFYANGPSGVLNITAVAPSNAPMFISKPHFLGADPGFITNVTGLHPIPAKHDSHLNVEPLTGAVLKAEKRIQLNLLLKQYKWLPDISKVKNVMIPIFYGCEEGSISPDLADEFKSAVYTVKYGVTGGVWAVIGLAGLTFIVSVLCLVGLVIQQCRRGTSTRRVNGHVNSEYSPLLRNQPDI